jgi:hypothetical protein
MDGHRAVYLAEKMEKKQVDVKVVLLVDEMASGMAVQWVSYLVNCLAQQWADWMVDW